MDQKCCDLIRAIDHSQDEGIRRRQIADNMMTMSPLRYSNEDASVRSERGLASLPDPFLNDKTREKWFSTKEIGSFLDRKRFK